MKNIRFYLNRSTVFDLTEKASRLPIPTFDNVKLVLALFSIVRPDPTFVQIGAYDGRADDPASEFVLTGRFRSLLVEPIGSSFRKLKKTYDGMPNVRLVQAAVGHADGKAAMFKVRVRSRADTIPNRGISSFSKAHLLKHDISEADIQEVEVPCLTLKSLLAQFGFERIDILQIDTEGFDAEVVKMALALDIPPDCINFENLHLSLEAKAELYRLLTHRGYVFSHDKFNSMAVHRRLTESLLAFCQKRGI